ncbi:MAG: septum formation initiator family protein [Thermodesulfobacteriota bacterium]|nr:septum formation initiator family protein [Thermodesulfobacteriota bacterium]
MNKKYLLTFLVLFIFIVFFFTTFGKMGIIKIYHLTKDRNNIHAFNERINRENLKLKEEISSIKRDERYIEMIARQRLGLIKEDEIIYLFIDKEEKGFNTNDVNR